MRLSIPAGLGAMLAAAVCLVGCSHHVHRVDSVTTSLKGSWLNVVVDEQHAYYCKDAELRILDTSPTLEKPLLVSSLTLPEKAMVRAVSGRQVFLTGSDGSRLLIVDTSDISSPRIVGGFAPAACDAAAASGNLLVLTYAGRLSILDVSTPSAPSLLSSHDLPNRPYDIVMIKDRVLCPCDFSGLVIMDVSNPAKPVRADRYEDKTCFRGVDAPGPLVFAACGAMGSGRLQIGDMSNPSNPVLVGMLNMRYVAFDVAGAGTLAYVAMGNAGMDVVDVSDPRSPRLCGTYRGWGLAATRVAVSGPFVFLWNDSNATGLDILRFEPGLDKTVAATVLATVVFLIVLAAAAWKWRSAIWTATKPRRVSAPELAEHKGVIPSSLLAGVGETFVAELLFLAAFAAALCVLVERGSVMAGPNPGFFWLPAAILPCILCMRSLFRRKHRRAAGNALGFLLAIPALLYLLVIVGFSIYGVP